MEPGEIVVCVRDDDDIASNAQQLPSSAGAPAGDAGAAVPTTQSGQPQRRLLPPAFTDASVSKVFSLDVDEAYIGVHADDVCPIVPLESVAGGLFPKQVVNTMGNCEWETDMRSSCPSRLRCFLSDTVIGTVEISAEALSCLLCACGCLSTVTTRLCFLKNWRQCAGRVLLWSSFLTPCNGVRLWHPGRTVQLRRCRLSKWYVSCQPNSA
jgi:hypothetical protein